jgi:hypothetical protein
MEPLFPLRNCWLRRRRHRWSRWVETMVGSECVCTQCGIRDTRNFVDTYIR